jgi:hypothetical protein
VGPTFLFRVDISPFPAINQCHNCFHLSLVAAKDSASAAETDVDNWQTKSPDTITISECVFSGFGRGVNDIFVLPGCYAAKISSY